VKCPRCKSEILDNSRFCSSCGSRVAPPKDAELTETKPFVEPSGQPEVGSEFAGRYKIMEELGRGGMGVVYKAEDTKLKRLVAIKLLPPHLTRDPITRQRFIHEAQAASSLDHPNICTIYEIHETEDGQIFISMSCYEGESLEGRIQQGPIEIEEAIDLAIQVGKGLSRAHEKGIVHRDIKPGNIFMTDDGRAKILDFGLAKLTGQTRLTKTGTAVGTVSYMSPEQARGHEADHRADIWSLGAALYEMITGGQPFKGDYAQAVIYSILNEDPKPPAHVREDIPAGLERVVYKALAKDPEERYQSVEDLVEDLEQIRRDSGYGGPSRIPTTARAARFKRSMLLIGVPAAVVTVALTAYFVFTPFRIELGPLEKAAIAQENSVAVMYFENMVDPEDRDRTAETVTNLIIADLSESDYMRIMSRQRLHDLLQAIGEDDRKATDRATAMRVADKDSMKWILTGAVEQVEPNIILTSDISRATAGAAFVSQRIIGEAGEDVFAVSAKLSKAVRRDMELPDAGRDESNATLSVAMTRSGQAYRYYLEGLELEDKYLDLEAEEKYLKALEFDSTFAQPYLRLANIRQYNGRHNQAREATNRALEDPDKLSQKEQWFAEAMDQCIAGDHQRAVERYEKIIERYPNEKSAWHSMGLVYHVGLDNPEEALRCYNKVAELAPMYARIHNEIAYAYDRMGDGDRSLLAANLQVSLLPENVAALATAGRIYAKHGRLREAIEFYERALDIAPDYSDVVESLGNLYVLDRRYADAESCYVHLVRSANQNHRARGRLDLAYAVVHQGRLRDALRVLDDGIAADRMEGVESWSIWPVVRKRELRVLVNIERREYEDALEEARQITQMVMEADPEHKSNLLTWQVAALANAGKYEQAERTAKALRERMEQQGDADLIDHWFSRGTIELLKGNPDVAAMHIETALSKSDEPSPLHEYLLAKAYLESGRSADAVTQLERMLSRYDDAKAFYALFSVKGHYLLGIAYEQSGWNSRAIDQYEEFLDIWNEADPDLNVVDDARRRLANLRQA
jgi:tetratricopeptide (TPR) repeat protein